jgi:hypothetical protein
MKIRIRSDAAKRYVDSKMADRCPTCASHINWGWVEKLTRIQGRVLEVDTQFLFRHQFNVFPVPGVFPIGIRIVADSVAEVIDDVRPGKARCENCGRTFDACKPLPLVEGDTILRMCPPRKDVCPHCLYTNNAIYVFDATPDGRVVR